jgi:hypothetical protein
MLAGIAAHEDDPPARIERQGFDDAEPTLVAPPPSAPARQPEMAREKRYDGNEADHETERAQAFDQGDGFHGDPLFGIGQEQASRSRKHA